jgi:hypothetical protein
MPKKILAVGLELASDEVIHDQFSAKISLLDWDIVLFRPIIDTFVYSTSENYKGRPSLGDYSSFALKEACAHWRREIKDAVEHGKTVIAFLPALKEVYVATGERQYSGTGRNQRTTTVVALHNNYAALPVELAPVNSTGTGIKLAAHSDIIGPYWAEFGSLSTYEVVLSSKIGVCLTTKTGDKPVGVIVRAAKSAGALVLLPNLDFAAEEFFNDDENEDEIDTDDGEGSDNNQSNWTAEARQFANRMMRAVIALDGALHSSADFTPEPAWASDPVYTLKNEQVLRSDLLEAERQLEAAQTKKEQIQQRLKEAGNLRSLLYEKGKPLERAIVEGLQVMGFKAHPLREGDSEFDVVFESAEGRLIGEAEGKDTKSVNIDKLRQLTMNIQEDLQRDEVDLPAKGVLFGNGYRLSPPTSREKQFTQKCITSSQSMNTALVQTSDLFRSVQYLTNTLDPDYAKACREALLNNVGFVSLPVPPVSALETTESAIKLKDNGKLAESVSGEDFPARRRDFSISVFGACYVGHEPPAGRRSDAGTLGQRFQRQLAKNPKASKLAPYKVV